MCIISEKKRFYDRECSYRDKHIFPKQRYESGQQFQIIMTVVKKNLTGAYINLVPD